MGVLFMERLLRLGFLNSRGSRSPGRKHVRGPLMLRFRKRQLDAVWIRLRVPVAVGLELNDHSGDGYAEE